MIAISYGNPFKDIMPGGSPGEPFSKPSVVFVADCPYQVLMLWDRPILKAKNTSEVFNRMVEDGVTAQVKLRERDGTEWFGRIIDDNKVQLTLTGFSSAPPDPKVFSEIQPPSQKEIDMTILQKFHEYVISLYEESFPDEELDALQKDLSKSKSLTYTRNYLAWESEAFQEHLENFFTLEL